jgi:DNA polymerase IV
VKPEEATADDRVIYHRVKALFDEVWSGAGVRLLGVGVSDWAEAGMLRQGDLFETPRETRSEQVLEQMDQLRDRFGAGVVHHAGAADSARSRPDRHST